jgi:pimeloyl-ACP methyl ester carboxylesterase
MNEFSVRVPQASLDDLRRRLGSTRWPSELPGVGWDYGIPVERVQKLAAAWEALDWRRVEGTLNAYPQFMTRIDGQDVHFVHVRSSSPSALPLILTHGWPGSVVEFQQVIPLLSAHFHLVIPSIPGFGFSGPTSSTGWSLMRVARAWAALMESLGYTRYGAQGGDFGSGISRLLASVAPSSVVGVHVNYLPSMGTPRSPLSATDQERLEKTRRLASNRHPHQVMFASTPQTLAYAMNDSPAGVLAFLAEKFTVWADPSTPVPDEAILTDVMVYWATGTFGSAARLIKETGLASGPSPCPAPLGVAVLPQDITQSIRHFVEERHDIRRWTEFPRGGHFAALEVPSLLADDVTAFFTALA